MAVRPAGDYRAPSWSWASVDSMAYELVWKWRAKREGQVSEIEVLEGHAEPELGGDPTGRVRAGRLVVRGRVVDAATIWAHRLHPEFYMEDWYFMKQTSPSPMTGGSDGQVYFDCKADREAHADNECAGLFALFVLSSTFPAEEQTNVYCGLVLRKLGFSSDEGLQGKMGSKALDDRFLAGSGRGALGVYERVGCFHIAHRDSKDCVVSVAGPLDTIVMV